MYRPVLIEAPALMPVTLAEAKVQCRATDFTDDDDKLSALIVAATSYLDGWTGILRRALCEQTWRQDFDTFSRCMRLPLFPVISITDLKYSDADGAEQTLASEEYGLQGDALGAFLRFGSASSFPAVRRDTPRLSVTYVAGYANAGSGEEATVPAAIKHAILMLVAHWYENREAVTMGSPVVLPMAVDALLAPFRRIKF